MKIPHTIIYEKNVYSICMVDGKEIDEKNNFVYADVDFSKHLIRLRKGVKKTITEEGFLHELIHLCEDQNKRLSEKIVDDFARRLYEILQRNKLFAPNCWRIPVKIKFEAHSIDIIQVNDKEIFYYDLDKSLLKIKIKKRSNKAVLEKIFFLIIMELCDSETHPIKTKIRDKIAKKLYVLLVDNKIIEQTNSNQS